MNLLLGIDIGTTATKAVLLGPERDLVAEAERPASFYSDRPGWAEEDVEGCEMTPLRDPIRGALVGISTATTRGHLLRAVLESIAFAFLGGGTANGLRCRIAAT